MVLGLSSVWALEGFAYTLLALAAIGLVVPAMFHAVATSAVASAELSPAREVVLERGLSLEIAVVLFVAYLLSLVFSLRTHRHLYAGQSHREAHDAAEKGGASPLRAGLTLLVATALVAWMSEILVGRVEEAARALGLTEVFVGVIVVAIIGNAAEHSTAILVALKNKMDLALNIAIGSSIQVALFVAPLLVFLSFLMPHGPMDLRFTVFEVLSVAIAGPLIAEAAQHGLKVSPIAQFLMIVLVLGAEREGLPPELLDQCDQRASIPQPGGGESLNVALAGAIVLYELARRNPA